ncbi:hypothetical protein N9571_07435 [Yoonia sp.]|nr:hypothetical protein [Yoonia sp.]
MLSSIAHAILPANRKDHWDAPDFFKQTRGPRNTNDLALEARRRHQSAMRGVGMW